MTIGSTMWDNCDAALLALTARERWEATTRVQPHSGGDYTVIVMVALLLLALVVVLWWILHRRSHAPSAPARDLFSDGAARRGLGTRDRQMLLAIAARGGLKRNHDIFITPDAFDQGAAKLLEECARSRTAQETERLRVEAAALREKLAYRVKAKHEQTRPKSSRDIAIGATVELLRPGDPKVLAIEATVTRNDNLGIAVETQMSLGSAAVEGWRLRYRLDGIVWQLDTSAVSCEDRGIVFHHGQQVRAVKHDRADRLAIDVPATVARFPFVQTTAMGSKDMAPTDWFELVHGVVTEVSESSLQVHSPLAAQVGEKVLVVFVLGPAYEGEATTDSGHRGHTILHVGRVKHRQTVGEEAVITIDLTDLTNSEFDELMRLAQAAASDAQVMQGV